MSVNLTKQILEEMIQKEMNSLLLKEVRETSAEKNRRISQKNVLTKFKNMNAQKITSMINDSSLIKVFDDLDEQIYFLYSPLAGSEGRNISAYSINMFKPAWWADSQSGVEDLFHAINRWFKNSSGPGISKAKIKENYKVVERFYYDTNSTLRTAKRKIPKKYYSQAIQNTKKIDS